MKKKPERYSFKKLTAASKKLELKYNEDLKVNNQKPKTQSKNRSVQRTFANDSNYKFKVKGNLNYNDKQVIKTEADEYISYKTPYQKFVNLKKRQKEDKYRLKPEEKSKIMMESKYRNIKRLHLNSDLFKNNSLEKSETPHSGKHYSFRKPHQSHRSNKKTALERYISESLENLDYPNKKKNKSSISKNQTGRNTLKKKGDQTLYKEKKHPRRVFEDTTREIKEDKHQSKHFNESGRKIKTDKDESLEKIQIKWEKKKKNPYDLNREEQEIFGDRFPDGFEKIKLLGRGGFSLVWLGEHKKSKKKYAVKQIITESSHQTHIKQIWFGTYFFEFGGAPKQQFSDCPGIKNLVKLYYYFINKKDTWILYEKCGDSLGNVLYQLKGEEYNKQKVYRINYKDFYHRIRKNQNQLRRIIVQVAQALQLLSQNNIVHSDLKTENILIRLKTEQQEKDDPTTVIAETRLIDYGSSFVFNNLRQFSMATPQYMAPEILNFILYENEFEYIPKLFDYVQQYNNPWVIDVWSLGSVILEIVSGIPLWMSLKTIVKKKSVEVIKYGLFAIKGRSFDKIIKRQLEVIQNLDYYLNQQNYSGIHLEEDLRILLKKMLALNPAKRISPTEIIEFLTNQQSLSSK